MKAKEVKKEFMNTNFDHLTDEELADAYVFPADKSTKTQLQEEDEFWKDRRKNFEERPAHQKIYASLLQLKFQLEDYIGSDDYKEILSFGYFLHEYVCRQNKKDKEFAAEVDVTAAVLSQYINDHRKPKEEFVIRLELHSNGMIPAISWFKVIQKSKENEIINNQELRREESKHVKKRLEFVY